MKYPLWVTLKYYSGFGRSRKSTKAVQADAVRRPIQSDWMKHSPLLWGQNTNKDALVLMLPNDESIVLFQNRGNHTVVGTVNGNKFRFNAGTSLPDALRQADAKVKEFGGKDLVNNLLRNLDDTPATQKQVGCLLRHGILDKPGMTRGEASKLIDLLKTQSNDRLRAKLKKDKP